jgi:hypothetical protein
MPLLVAALIRNTIYEIVFIAKNIFRLYSWYNGVVVV